MKSIIPIQKYPHITESYACILKMFVTTVDLSTNFYSKTVKVNNIII